MEERNAFDVVDGYLVLILPQNHRLSEGEVTLHCLEVDWKDLYRTNWAAHNQSAHFPSTVLIFPPGEHTWRRHSRLYGVARHHWILSLWGQTELPHHHVSVLHKYSQKHGANIFTCIIGLYLLHTAQTRPLHAHWRLHTIPPLQFIQVFNGVRRWAVDLSRVVPGF